MQTRAALVDSTNLYLHRTLQDKMQKSTSHWYVNQKRQQSSRIRQGKMVAEKTAWGGLSLVVAFDP